MIGLTPRAHDLLRFIVERHRAGQSWTSAQARAALGVVGVSTQYRLLHQLVDRGYVERLPHGRVRPLPAAFAACPVVPVRRAPPLVLRPRVRDGSYPFLNHRTCAEIFAEEQAA